MVSAVCPPRRRSRRQGPPPVDLAALIERNRRDGDIGLPCFCTANELALRAVLAEAVRTGGPAVIEATCNQVNQDGGYTGMTPAAFIAWLRGMAEEAGLPEGRLILGGDHLGPNPWRHEPVSVAMDKARALVRDYAAAGFTKIHLDASMACGGEPTPGFEQVAERAADLCAVAERHAPDPARLVYVIGTEVPVPGGETDAPDALDITSVERLEATIETHRAAFAARRLEAARDRIVAVVTQPGVDFGHSAVHAFAPAAAAPLADAIGGHPGLTFEAHSTDYQPDAALGALVAAHFFFLKVGPELTFRLREAIFALSRIEAALFGDSALPAVIEARMQAEPGHWRPYYRGTEAEVARLRRTSYSDRIRYYWSDPEVSAALSAMLARLRAAPLPAPLVSEAFMSPDVADLPTDPDSLIAAHLRHCVGRYRAAAGWSGENWSE